MYAIRSYYVPILAAAGLLVPKTSSRSITSPAGTADTVEVLCDVSFNVKDITKIVKKANGCMVWGGAVKLAVITSYSIHYTKLYEPSRQNSMKPVPTPPIGAPPGNGGCLRFSDLPIRRPGPPYSGSLSITIASSLLVG